MVFAILYDSLLVATCLLAAFYGGWEERGGAFTVLVATLLTVFTAGPVEYRYDLVSPRLTLIDASALACFVAVMLQSRKFWPLWATAMQLISVFANFAPLLEVHRWSLAYAIAEQMWAWLILGLIASVSVRVRRSSGNAKSLPHS